jgi:ABC-type polysaccharide/polyol phosphate export permease
MSPLAIARSLLAHRALAWRLAMTQLRSQYASTFFGAIWAVLQPAATVAVYWFVFTFGIRMASNPSGPPFLLMLIVALSAWFFFNDAIIAGQAAVVNNAYMLKKIAFPVEILPAVPIAAAGLVHAGVLGFVLLLVLLNGVPPSWHLLLLIYYTSALTLLASGIAYLLASLSVFQRDWAQLSGLVLQLWFWLTPIVWSPEVFSPRVRAVLAFNPMFYVVEGYRDALLNGAGQLPTLATTVSFWCVTLAILGLGGAVFGRLRPDFADVL